ncbi:hypothetical protein GIB67_012336 [Kingdonia uniflora]|uniref:acetate--CoA ligase n=1 Tax=Kingdonia uniflora TaxID=39325 RepID=A0A7J7MVF9_9MAGN|nr:hypothetical protein GIB67_012336 [Kingdonia uniflora]
MFLVVASDGVFEFLSNQAVRNGDIKIQWFKGGVTNIYYNALDKNIQVGLGDKTTFFWEGNDLGQDASLTFNQLLNKACQLANYLKDIGIKKGDAIIIYLPMLMELLIAMLACAHIDVAFVKSTNNGVFSLTYENQSAMMRETTNWQIDRDVWWKDIVSKYPTTCEVEWVNAENPYFLLYTSGSTGKPKAVRHTTGGYMIYTAATFKYETAYFKPFPSYYFSGDSYSRDKDGFHWLTGRVDDVFNVSDHRIGTTKVESALVSHQQCAEAVVGVEHKVKGQGIYAFVTLVGGGVFLIVKNCGKT